MDEQALAPVVTKVEAGEPLEAHELARLEAAVAERPASPDWLLCLGHALVNADRAAQALGWFEKALAARPDGVIALVGRARALGALERYRESAADLRRALAIQPGHADAMRALALLRLREGGFADAEELASRVLRADPLDDAARQILEEARAAKDVAGEAPRRIGREDFARALASRLAARGLDHRFDEAAGAVVVRLAPEKAGRLSLESLRSGAPAGDAVDGYLDSVVAGLERMKAGAGPSLEQVRDRLRPVLRPRSFLGRSGPVLHADGPAGLVWLYALDDPEYVSFLDGQAAQRWGVRVDELAAAAMQNLDRDPVPPARYRAREGRLEELAADAREWDLLAYDQADGYDASRLLAPRHRALRDAVAPGPFVVALPSPSYALLARASDAPALAALRAFADAEGARPDGLGAQTYLLEGERLEQFQ